MLNIYKLSFSRGSKEILNNISVNMETNEKIGLVGVNGAGKSTILKLIVGIEEPDLGSIKITGTMSYLGQEIHRDISESKAFNSQDLTIGEYIIIEKNIPVEEWEIKRMLNNLGMLDKDCDSKMVELSGGQKVKVELIRILLEESDLLILDEPTNFLDIPSVEWLMKYLNTYPKAVLMVSHDLRLMNRSISKIWFLNERTHEIEVYNGNYEKFLKLKELQDEFIFKQLKAQEKRVKKMFESAQTLSGRKSKEEKGRAAKKFEKVKEEKLHMEEMEKKLTKSKHMHISIPKVSPSSINVLEVSNLSKIYIGDTEVLKDVSFSVSRGDRIAVIGKNGVGKTTLLRILAGKIAQTKGDFKWGYNCNIGYYSQENEDLRMDRTVLENFQGMLADDLVRRKFLGRFLISGDMVEQRVDTLSGGEKTRLALARLFAGNYNVLLLDEPTTYLDPVSQKILLTALKEYDGTLLLVSHEPLFVRDLNIKKVLLMPEEHFGYFRDEYIQRVGIM